MQRWTGKTMADTVAAIMAELNLVATEDPGADVDLALRRLCLDSTGTFSKKVARLLSELFDGDVDMEAAERARVAAEKRSRRFDSQATPSKGARKKSKFETVW